MEDLDPTAQLIIDGKTTSQGSALTGYVRQYSANDILTALSTPPPAH